MELPGKACNIRKYIRTCAKCSVQFSCAKPKGIYCSNTCRNIVWRNNNRSAYTTKQKNWISSNLEQHRLNQSSYQKNRSKTDPVYLLKRRLRSRLGRIANRFGVSHIKDLGCSSILLRAHIESQFYGNMDWNNYGKVWQIDHRVSLSNAKTKDELIVLCHFTNLQPLLVEDHITKTSKENSK